MRILAVSDEVAEHLWTPPGAWVTLLALALTGCSASHGSGSVATPSTASTAPRPVATTPAPATAPPTASPTTAWKPAAPQASPDAAAARLVNAWAAGDRTTAATVASPAAVAALFAVPYPGPGLAIPRGCSAGFPPIVCTYGPPGGAAPTASVYEISVAQDPGGWYVTSARALS